jgi:hypothetical protein
MVNKDFLNNHLFVELIDIFCLKKSIVVALITELESKKGLWGGHLVRP